MENAELSIIAGVFRDHAKADRALEDLKQAGFRDDQLGSTVYSPSTAQEAKESEYAPEHSRIVVTVKADGREQDAVGILFDNGANNADLPPGTVLKQGAIVSAEQEAVDLISKPAATEGTFYKDSFFADEKEPDRGDEYGILDSSNFPRG